MALAVVAVLVVILLVVGVVILIKVAALSGLGVSETRLASLQNVVSSQIAALVPVVHEAAATSRDEARTSASELRAEVGQRVEGMRTTLDDQVARFAVRVQTDLHALQEASVAASRGLQESTAAQLLNLRREQDVRLKDIGEAQTAGLTALRGEVARLQQSLTRELGESRATLTADADRAAQALVLQVHQIGAAQLEALAAGRKEQSDALRESRLALDARLREFDTSVRTGQEAAKKAVGESLEQLRATNDAKLEQMRETVQEKLDKTIGERFTTSFKSVNDSLATVAQHLGEVKTLAQGVGSLERTLTNVRTRGAWGELQLESLLSDLLSGSQYDRQVRVVPGKLDPVDFALRLPGGDDGRPVWLPIDAKFPMGVFDRLLAAYEGGDPQQLREAGKQLEDRVRAEAKSISGKYVAPPHTTDFAVMYLPTEGLFAEVVRRPGLVQDLRLQHRIVVAGPTTLTALLGSLSLGFRSLAIQERTSEVWRVVGDVQKELDLSGDTWEKMVKQLETATKTANDAGTRYRVLSRRLTKIEMPDDDAPAAADLRSVPTQPRPGGETPAVTERSA